MPGEINSESIIDNKAATKFYWEKRMRACSTSDLTAMSLGANNRFLSNSTSSLMRQESKFFDDTEEDGGFESFQVADDDNNYDDQASFSPNSVSPDQGVGMVGPKPQYRAPTFAQSQQAIPSAELQKKAATVLDLINSEISDLHMREIELKKKTRRSNHSTGENEGDELAGGTSEDDYSDSAIDFESYTGTSNSSGNVTPASVFRGGSHTPSSEHDLTGTGQNEEDEAEDEGDGDGVEDDEKSMSVGYESRATTATSEEEDIGKGISNHKVRPLVDAEVKTIEFTGTNETPIEREIRSSREREEEFRKLKSIPSVDKSAQETESMPISTPRKINRSAFVTSTERERVSLPATTNKDIQYELATARLRREIEENLMRERELFREGRLKTLTLESEDGNDDPGTEKVEVAKNLLDPIPVTPGEAEHRNILPSMGKKSYGKVTNNKTDDKPAATAARFTSLTVNNSNSFDNSVLPSPDVGGETKTPQSPSLMSISRPNFNSMERYLLKSSFKFAIGKRLEVPVEAPQEVKVSKEEEKVEEPQDEKETGEREEEKPRRKYVRAQDKIEMELKEMMERENELTQLRAKWKSTPNLSSGNGSMSEDSDEGKPAEPTGARNILREKKKVTADDMSDGSVTVPSGFGKPTVRRRQSALINRWEEMIKQQQQQQQQ